MTGILAARGQLSINKVHINIFFWEPLKPLCHHLHTSAYSMLLPLPGSATSAQGAKLASRLVFLGRQPAVPTPGCPCHGEHHSCNPPFEGPLNDSSILPHEEQPGDSSYFSQSSPHLGQGGQSVLSHPLSHPK